MDKKLGLKLLFKSPFSVIMGGLRAQENEFYKGKLNAEYGITQLPTINLLDLFPDLDEELNFYSFLGGTSLVTDLILLKSLARRCDKCC